MNFFRLKKSAALAALVCTVLVVLPASRATAHGFGLHGANPFRFGISMYIARQLRIGVTLPPYHGMLTNLVLNRAEIVPLTRAMLEETDPERWAETVEILKGIDLLLVSEHEQDEFTLELLEKADLMYTIPLVYPDLAAPPLRSQFEDAHEGRTLPRPYAAVQVSTQQIYAMGNALLRMDPANNLTYRTNVRDFAAELRAMKAAVLEKLDALEGDQLSVVSLQGGSEYLLEEVGMRIAGTTPVLTEDSLDAVIAQLKILKPDVVVSEVDLAPGTVAALKAQTGATVCVLQSVMDAPLDRDAYASTLRANLESLTDAMLAAEKE